MKKTLALALVAAMTISMVSMTAFAKDVKYNTAATPAVDEPEKVVATVTLKKKDLKENKDQIIGYKAKEAISGYTADQVIDADTYDKLGDTIKGKFEKQTGTTYTIKFGDLGLKKYDNTATKTFYGWAEGDNTATDGTFWAVSDDPTKKDKVVKDDYVYTFTDGDFDTDGSLKEASFAGKFSTVGRTDTTDEQIAKNLEKIENAKKDKEEAEANKKDLEKWDEEHNATNNVLKTDDDGKDVLDTAQARVTPMGTKWDNKDAEYWGNDDYCRHAAQVIGLGDDAGDIYDIYAVEAPFGFLKGKSARITLEPISIKKPGDFNVTVYHVEGWCKAKKVKDFKIVDNKIVLWGDSFSPYVVVYEAKDAASAGTKDASNPSTGDFSAVPVALLAAAALGATGFVAYKKRKAE